eukprot:497256-Hanusia_phi.AAC.1
MRSEVPAAQPAAHSLSDAARQQGVLSGAGSDPLGGCSHLLPARLASQALPCACACEFVFSYVSQALWFGIKFLRRLRAQAVVGSKDAVLRVEVAVERRFVVWY